MDWVHCNMCFMQPGDVEGKKFSITNCGHIYCAECLQSGDLEECRHCHVKFNTIPLTSKMSPEVENYFLDPIQNIQKQVKILEFQQNHRIRLVAYNRAKLASHKTLKKENLTLKEELKRCKEEALALREEVKRRREEVYQYKKKCEYLLKNVQNRHAPQAPASQFTVTPNDQKAPHREHIFSQGSYASENSSPRIKLKRPPMASDLFKTTNDNSLFTTPTPPKFLGNYRNVRNSTPETSSPNTPDSITSYNSQTDPLQRRIKLPGDKGGPSPSSRIGLQRLSLSRTSTPIRENSNTNKYLKYF